MKQSEFKNLGLNKEILKAIELRGYEKPSPIQAAAIPELLNGSDLFACAQTGTGKTAAFVLPILQKLAAKQCFIDKGEFRALVLVPTRELADQVGDNASFYAKFLNLNITKIFGGVSQYTQIKALKNGVDLLIATPGRLLDLHNQRELSFRAVEFLVLDEADRMLDMGFIKDIKKICSYLPGDRQSMLFSATLAQEVQELAASIVKNPKKISISSDNPTVDKIKQKLCFVDKENKPALLKHIIEEKFEKDPDAIALVFCRTKHGANRVANRLSGKEFNASVIHGNKSQSSRKNALERFKNRESKVLVATDIAARGIDVKAMPLVINYELPEEPETYVHRIGRTARAEAEGEAVSLCSPEEVGLLKAIQKFIHKEIPQAKNNPYHSQATEELALSGKKVPFKREKTRHHSKNISENSEKKPAATDKNSNKNQKSKTPAKKKDEWNWRAMRGSNKPKKPQKFSNKFYIDKSSKKK